MLISPEAEALFNEALTLAPAERNAFLADACAHQPLLFDEVSSLLTAANESEAYFDGLSNRVGLSALAQTEEADIFGKVLGQWRLVSLLGRGGMGSVYLAERADGQFEKCVALKTLPIGLDNDVARTRFINERQILAKLVHDNIARLLDGGVGEDGTPYFVMDYVEGTRIDEYCTEHGCSIGQRVDLLLEVARGVQFAHRNLIIHRDLKPTNILIDHRGKARLLDFGIAKVLESNDQEDVTRMAQRPVTPAYASPEMLRGESVDVTTDVYSLGVILYQLLTGELPLSVDNLSLAELHAHISTAVPTPASQRNGKIDSDLDAVVAKALAKEPSERYSSVESLIQDLSYWRRGLPVTAKAPSPFYRAGKFVRRNVLGVTAASLAVLGLAGFASFATQSAARSEQQAKTIAEERDRAEAVKNFMVSIFEAAGPKAGGEKLTATQILEAGRERVKDEFAEQPAVRADMLQTIANVYAGMGMTEQMREMLIESKALVKELDGENSDTYFSLIMALAEAEDMLGNYEEAEKMSYELIDIGKAIGDGASEGDARGRLGRMLHLKGDYEGADREYRESVRLLEESLGTDSMRTARAMLHLATLLDHTEQHEQAYQLFLDVENIHKRVKQDEEIVETDLYLGMARALTSLGRYDEALTIYQRTLDANIRLYGEDYQFNLYLLNGMSSVAEKKGDYERALELQSGAMRLIKMYTPEGPNVGRSLFHTGRIYYKDSRCEHAIPALRQALDVFARKLPEHVVNGEAMWRLGDCLAQFNERDEAEVLLVNGNAILADKLASDHDEVVSARRATAAFFTQTGQPAKARDYQ